MAVLNGSTKLGVMTALTLGAACGSGHLATSNGDATSGGTAQAGTGGVPAKAAASAVVSTGALGAGGGPAPACDPSPAAGSFWAQTAQQYGVVGPVSMCDYRGDVLLVVNTADA